MAQEISKNGSFELKFTEDKTQVLATIYPATGNGESATVHDVLEYLKQMGVTYGIREQLILDTIHRVNNSSMPMIDVIIAQGAVPQDGEDARVQYAIPQDILALPLSKRSDGSGLPDWFALNPQKIVSTDQVLATITPPKAGAPGKTLTWPIQTILPRPGLPAAINAGQNVRTSGDGLRLLAECDGYACLQGAHLNVYAVRLIADSQKGCAHVSPTGAVFLKDVCNSQIRSEGVVAINGIARDSEIRAHGDVFLRQAENCAIISTGNVYVTELLLNCEINTRQQVIALQSARIVGGSVCAATGVHAFVLGSDDFTPTQVQTGIDRFSSLRLCEIKEELASCEANIARISQALKPFGTLAVHTTLTDDKRSLVQKLQAQSQSLDYRMKELLNERRLLTITAKQKMTGDVTVTDVAHPGVWIGIGAAAAQVEVATRSTRFVVSSSGRSVEARPLKSAA